MIDKAKSFYLECLRIFAAFYVFIYHFGSELVEGKNYLSPYHFNESLHINWYSAHFFVIVFFVLSGFLITMSASKNGMTFRKFLTARLGRMYSVVIPSLIFSYLVAFALTFQHLELDYNDHLIPRFFLNLFFLSQSWTLCAMPPTNGPFWSISYEFLYYLLMGSILLVPQKIKIILVFSVALIAGPKVLLLFPVWLIGSCLFYVSRKKHVFSSYLSFSLFCLSSIVIFFTLIFPYDFPFLRLSGDYTMFGYKLFFSWNYQSDYLFSCLIFLNIYSFFGFSNKLNPFFERVRWATVRKTIFHIGNCTFTLYLFHVPIMLLLASLFPYNKENHWHNTILILATLFFVYSIAQLTEQKVEQWRKRIEVVFDYLLQTRVAKLFRSLAYSRYR